jgi:hypothetical protein
LVNGNHLKRNVKGNIIKGGYSHTRIHTHNIKINGICNRLLINKIKIKNKLRNEGFNTFCKGLGRGWAGVGQGFTKSCKGFRKHINSINTQKAENT